MLSSIALSGSGDKADAGSPLSQNVVEIMGVESANKIGCSSFRISESNRKLIFCVELPV